MMQDLNMRIYSRTAPIIGDRVSTRDVPQAPITPFSPISPITPSNATRSPNFGLKQSVTPLATDINLHDVDTNDISDIFSDIDESVATFNTNKTKSTLITSNTQMASNTMTASTLIASSVNTYDGAIDDDDKDDVAGLSTKDLLSGLAQIDSGVSFAVKCKGSTDCDTGKLMPNHTETGDCILADNGYQEVRKISNTLQGEITECLITDPYKRAKAGLDRVAIKRTSKKLYRSSEAQQEDGFTVIVEENIIKESMILKYLTKDNHPNGGYIAKFVDFFESKTDYYLVMEYVGCKNLAQFVKQAHIYIKRKKLKLSAYKKVVKFIFWQISNIIHWMHKDMRSVHLGLFYFQQKYLFTKSEYLSRLLSDHGLDCFYFCISIIYF